MDSHSLAERYCEFIKQSEVLNYSARRVAWGMYADKSRLPAMVEKLNSSIRSFNDSNTLKYLIPEVSDIPDNIELNHVHSLFEKYLPVYEQEHQHQKVESPLARQLFNDLNRINQGVHSLEGIIGIPDSERASGWFTFTLCAETGEHIQADLEDNDYDHFSLGRNFGDLFLGYSTTGKNLFHLMMNDDFELIRQGGKASPQITFSTNTICFFSSLVTHQDMFARLEKWFKDNKLEQYGYKLESKYNSLGYLRVGRFITPQSLSGKSEKEIISYYSDFSRIEKVCIIDIDSQPNYFHDSIQTGDNLPL